MDMLMILKQYQSYEALRKEELFMKLELKKNLGEAKEFLDDLSKSLPESKFLEEQEKREKLERELANKIEFDIQKSKKSEWKYWKEKEPSAVKEKIKGVQVTREVPATKEIEEQKSPIDKELEEIKRKLERLQ
jgi:hypothetical protein